MTGRREGKKVHKRTLANLFHWPKHKIERLRRLLKNEPLVHPDALFLIDDHKRDLVLGTESIFSAH